MCFKLAFSILGKKKKKIMLEIYEAKTDKKVSIVFYDLTIAIICYIHVRVKKI